MTNSALNFLFNESQQATARESLLEELREALADEKSCETACSDLSKLLKGIGLECAVDDCTVSYPDADTYATALDLLSSNLNDLTDGGWVYAPSGEVNTTNSAPRYVITFQQITVADEDNEADKKADTDIEDLVKQARELGMAPDDEELRSALDTKYAGFLKEGETADQAVERLLESDPELRTWVVRIFDDGGKEKESWEIENRTESEARMEAESDPAVRSAGRWTLTPTEIETKEGL